MRQETSYQEFYQDFLTANPDLIHMAAHSHHYWPDVAKQAVMQAYDDACRLSDLKWDKILGEVVPKSQKLISQILNLSHPDQIAFASNTHELLVRLLSCFDPTKKLRILTTDSEFHSANRQFKRMEELENVEITYVPAQTADFKASFLQEIKKGKHDLIFVSHVFFNTGKKQSFSDIEEFVAAKSNDALFVLDAYHGFCAIPTDLSQVEDKIFYLAGGYKYAQAGEGMCFMTIPKNCKLRPINTGWFASFDSLEKHQEKVGYANNGWRFAGSTRDFTAHYRFNYAWEFLLNKGLDVPSIHQFIKKLQTEFLKANKLADRFTSPDLASQGHFLALDTGSNTVSKSLYNDLKKNNILTDYRGRYLRFGFGLYQTIPEIQKVRDFLNHASL